MPIFLLIGGGIAVFFIAQKVMANTALSVSETVTLDSSGDYADELGAPISENPVTTQNYTASDLSSFFSGVNILMTLSDNGREHIKTWEKLALTPYKDQAGKNTIGYGHKILAFENYSTITEQDAEDLLDSDLMPEISAVNSAVTVPLTQNQFDALVSLVHNIGVGAFMSSTLLRKLNAGDYSGAGAQFADWNKITVNGSKVVSNGLVNRRASDLALYLA